MFNFRAARALIVGAAILVGACGDDSAPVVPGTVQVMAGDRQNGVVGTAVAIAPSVKVLSTSGNPLSGTKVTFSSSGDGVVTPAEQMTNAQGIATVTSWTLPKRSGEHQLTITTQGVAPVIVTATAAAGAPAKITRGAPEQQTASVGADVGSPPVVSVLDAHDNPVAGVRVTFAPSGSGKVRVAEATTDANGIARAEAWTLGGLAGAQTVLASVANSPATVTFTATAIALPATHLKVTREPTTTPRAGIVLPTQPAVQVTDMYGNPVAVPGVEVTAVVVGSPAISNAVATTNATGLATFSGLTITGTAGTYALRFLNTSYTAASSDIRLEAGSPASLAIVTQPSTTSASGQKLVVQPVVDVHDSYGNRVLTAGHAVTASLAPGTAQTLTGTVSIPSVSGRATFTDLVVNGTGSAQLRFNATGLPDATSAAFNVPSASACPGARMTLNFNLGDTRRFLANSPDAPACLDFTMTANNGQQYIVLVEKMTTRGAYTTGVFPGAAPIDTALTLGVTTSVISGSEIASNMRNVAVPEGATHAWDFGAGPIYEIEPKEPVGGAKPAYVKRSAGLVDASSSEAATAVGDTIMMALEGIPRLGINQGVQRAIVRYSGPDLIIAEDVRLGTLARQTGTYNTPLTQSQLDSIGSEYAKYAKVQADRFFNSRHNSATEQSGSRVIAVHSIMGADNIWGYTYSSTNYFVWDFWVGTDGKTADLNQHVQRNADNLFMHEIAHMRHWGMMERAGRTSVRGNRWLVEGFARATERWPIAMRLLGNPDPSRLSNLTLPLNTAFNNRYFRDDVPTFLQGHVPMYDGYGASGFVFDYFADQVARNGGNWMAALSDFLVNAGVEQDLNAAINRYLPGVDFGTLFTRSRIALFADDYGPGLPDWTQYHQFNLRASRPAGTGANVDPRNMWLKINPGASFIDGREIQPGASFGYIIDGTAATGDARVLLTPARTGQAVISVTRVK